MVREDKMFRLGKDIQIHPTAKINVEEGFIGDRSIIRAHAIIEGNRVEIGHEAYLDCYAHIGGGSCFDPGATLSVGEFLHMGRYSHINFARPVVIGHEFGCGIGTKVFAHGAYQSAWEGFPVQWAGVTIGDRVWMPHAWVNPGVIIGSDVVVAAMSLVNKDLPSGCLAGGIPAKVLRRDVYPGRLSIEEKNALFDTIFMQAATAGHFYEPIGPGSYRIDGQTIFDLDSRMIDGMATPFTEILKNQLRRNGIRFRFYAEDGGEYEPFDHSASR